MAGSEWHMLVLAYPLEQCHIGVSDVHIHYLSSL